MRDDEYTSENVIAVSFVEEANAYEALGRLKELEAKSAIGSRDAAPVVLGEEDGKIEQKGQFGHNSTMGTVSGGLLGLLIGVPCGPLGLLRGGATGLLVGSLLDDDDTAQTESVLSDISKSIKVGPPGLLADAYEHDNAGIDAVMAYLGGTVVRRSAADVELEIVASETAPHEAKEAAANELREAHRGKYQEEVKIAELKAKLHGHKNLAGTRSCAPWKQQTQEEERCLTTA